jgi:hypothetical protein
MTPAHALAQSVTGALTASATILPPITTPDVRPLSFRVQHDGIGRLETTSPFAGAVSAIVMSTVSTSANGFTPVPQPPALVSATPRNEQLEDSAESATGGAAPWRFELSLDAAPDRSEPHDVTVRITYLIVPGT